MTLDVTEADWKVFRRLREVAMERFCSHVVEDITRICASELRSSHDRYLEVYRMIHDRDDELGRAFNNPRRSQMLYQLAAIDAMGLLEPTDLARFTRATRERIHALTEAGFG